MSSSFDPSIESEIRNHCWNYFSLHAQQRMSAFQFFITLETALIGAGFFVLQSKPQFADSHLTIMIGPLMAMLAFIFWKIDQRTKDLIKNAEKSLLEIESFFLKNSTVVQHLPFSIDQQNPIATFPIFTNRLTYTKSFGTVFVVCGFLGCAFTFALITSLASK
ncbi:hypothetical protein [Rhodoferax ferrireducens]|uniref:RipA family octameric membrane protein n=1 Tax=Rhodoferax ferrireducens TaxID=192843 RepID=UPI00140FD232|nr:hypothetical protein [Rhodoferax ferrireducens]